MTSELLRAKIMMAFADAPKNQPTLKKLKESLSAASEQAIAYHIQRLVEIGFVKRIVGVGLKTTPQGRAAAVLLLAVAKPESYFQQMTKKLVKELPGVFDRQASGAIRRAAEQLDANYLVTRLGMRRRVRGKMELERKTSGRAIIQALKDSVSIEEAALQVGIQAGALHQRAARLLAKAKLELEAAQ